MLCTTSKSSGSEMNGVVKNVGIRLLTAPLRERSAGSMKEASGNAKERNSCSFYFLEDGSQ